MKPPLLCTYVTYVMLLILAFILYTLELVPQCWIISGNYFTCSFTIWGVTVTILKNIWMYFLKEFWNIFALRKSHGYH